MRLKYTLAAGLLICASAVNAQDWIQDTISTEKNYLKNVYYSLENGTAAKVDADNWHIGFSTGARNAGIISNSADMGVKLYDISSDVNKFGTDLRSALNSAITAKPMSLYNSNITWEEGAFNQAEGPGYGWGDYDMETHWVNGKKIFGLITGNDTFQVYIQTKQTFQVTNPPVYIFKVARIDGSGVKEKSFTTGVDPYKGKNFAYYNIVTDAFLDREPLANEWDFVFSNYNDASVVMGDAQYKVFGIINNERLEVAVVDSTPKSEFDNLNFEDYTDYDTANNSMGRAWKSAGQGGVKMTDSLCYFVKVANQDIWQLVFTYHTSGSDTTAAGAGVVGLQKRKVYEYVEVSVEKVNAFVNNVVIAPNPAIGGVTHLLVDAKQAIKNARLVITDLTGRTVYKAGVDLHAGFRQLPLQVGHYAPGIYMVNVSGTGFSMTQKLVVR